MGITNLRKLTNPQMGITVEIEWFPRRDSYNATISKISLNIQSANFISQVHLIAATYSRTSTLT